MIPWGKTQTELLVSRGAPELPEGYTYRLHVNHNKPPEVTAVIGLELSRGTGFVEVARFTEVTRADLAMASVAACRHAFEEWDQ
jgi:hypothetical protein